MCVTCGCNDHSTSRLARVDITQRQPFATSDVQFTSHDVTGTEGTSAPGFSAARMIRMEADVLGENKRFADANRSHFKTHGITALNLVSSPGSGKTTLLCASVHALKARSSVLPIAVIEGDQQTSLDSDRIRATGVPAIQVNTGRGCHLDAQMVAEAFSQLDLHNAARPVRSSGALLFVENVGNLVCPALWDLGEAAKIVVLSVTEGEDKPLKYPDMFAAAKLMVINKIDLMPHVSFDTQRCVEYARRINPGIEVLLVSATRGDGMSAWIDWLTPPVADDQKPYEATVPHHQ